MRTVLRRVSFFSLAIVVLLGGCGGSSSPSNPSSPTTPVTTPPAANYDGTWRGTTSQNLPVTFTVSGNAIAAISVDIRATYGNAACTYTTGSTQRPACPNGSFSIAIGGGTVSTTLRGTFSSAGAATGTIDEFSLSGLLCGNVFVMGTPISQASKTWQATRQ